MNSVKRFAAPFLLLAAVAAAAAILKHQPSLMLVLPSGIALQGWRSETVRFAWPAALAVCFALSALAWRLASSKPLAAVRPLAWLAFAAALSHAGRYIGVETAGFALPYGAALVLAAQIDAFFSGEAKIPLVRRLMPFSRSPAAVFTVAAIFLSAVWFGHAKAIGWRGGGDAKHYIAQIENLVEKGNLDLTDRMNKTMEERGIAKDADSLAAFFEHSHVKINAKGRIYSYHSAGYPLLAWIPVKVFGFGAEQWLRIFLGAFALAGIWASCRAAGASVRSAWFVCGILLPTVPFVYTALALLPEALGIALCAWAVWGALAQNRLPKLRVVAAAVAAACCGYLPLAHVRFAPMALALAGFFGIEALLAPGEKSQKGKLLRIAFFGIVCLASWLALYRSHSVIYAGTAAYPYSKVFMSSPRAMWAILADRRGLAATLPLSWPLFAAAVVCLFRRDTSSRQAALCLGTAFVIIVSCCSTAWAFVGNCMIGRFLLPAVPLLAPFLALALDRAGKAGRLWVFFLAAIAILLFTFASFTFTKNGITVSPEPMRRLSRLQALWSPLPAFYRTGNAASRTWGSLFVGISMALSALSLLPPRKRPVLRTATFSGLLLAAFFTGRAASRADGPDRSAAFTALCADKGMTTWKILCGGDCTLFEAFADRRQRSRKGAKKTFQWREKNEDGTDNWHFLRGRGIPPTPSPCRMAFKVAGKALGGSAQLQFVSGNVHGAATETGEGSFECIVCGTTEQGGATNLRLRPPLSGLVEIEDFSFVPVPSGIENVLPLK